MEKELSNNIIIDGWKSVKIGSLVEKMVGGCSTTKSDYITEGVLVLNKGHIKKMGIVDVGSRKRYVSKKYASDNLGRVIDSETVLVTLRDLSIKADFLGLIGKYRGIEKALITQGMCSLDLNKSVIPNYLVHYSNSPNYRNAVKKKKVGTTQVHLRNGDFLDIEIPLAPLDEQTRIVAEIEKQFSRLDQVVTSITRIQANLKRYKAAVLKAAVEGKLTEQWRKDHLDVEPAGQLLKRILAERRAKWEAEELAKMKVKEIKPKDDSWKNKYKESAGTDTANLPELPEGWVWTNVDQLAEVGTGATPRRNQPDYYENGDVPWVTSAVVNKPFVDEASEFVTFSALAETNLTQYPIGTLLVAMYGEGKTRGKCSELRISASTNQALAALQTDPSIRRYLRLFLDYNYEETRKVASGGVQPNLNLSLVRSLLVPLPPFAEQTQIVAEADRLLSVTEELESTIETNLKRAERLRQMILLTSFGGI